MWLKNVSFLLIYFNQSYSRVSDIYGFGILLYVLFSQKWPLSIHRLDELKKVIN